MEYLPSLFALLVGIVIGLFGLVIIIMISLRRVVPTNMVHIVQSSKLTTSFGRGRENGNTYYAIPSWVPVYGVVVSEFPESIFQVSLKDYDAYDKGRLPFTVDVTAFFRVEQSETVAQRVSSFEELQDQLDQVLKGAVRRVLATATLEHIMEARAELAKSFTEEVDAQIKQWGVTTVKTIEFMDLRDSKAQNSQVIHNIMSKEQARISQESRSAIAASRQIAELAEVASDRQVQLTKQEAAQAVGMREAEKDKAVGLAKESSQQEVLVQAKTTKQNQMDVITVENTRRAEIQKSVDITTAEAQKAVQIARAQADRESIQLASEAALVQTSNEAKGIQLKGEAEAKASELLLMAPVTAQVELATKIGENIQYQTYLIELRKVEVGADVGKAMADALSRADLKIISNGGPGNGEVATGLAGLADMFSLKGGSKLTGMLAALGQTEEGKELVKKVTG